MRWGYLPEPTLVQEDGPIALQRGLASRRACNGNRLAACRR
jgi:hypothetical protein